MNIGKWIWRSFVCLSGCVHAYVCEGTSLCGSQRSLLSDFFYHIVLKHHDQKQLTEESLLELKVHSGEEYITAGSQSRKVQNHLYPHSESSESKLDVAQKLSKPTPSGFTS